MRSLLCVSLLVLCLAACGDEGSYELSWTIGCAELGEPACQVLSVFDCSSRGVDSVEVIAAGETRTLFPCFSVTEGATGRGPGLAPGQAELSIYPLSAAGIRLAEVTTLTVQIPESGFAQASVDLPLPDECNDGVDNDGDGFVDGFDPGCQEGTAEAEPEAQ